jgi:acyl-CoA reductase-like NAD-dependent aldehyde dehydrogenase
MVFTSDEINNEALRQQPAKQEAAVPKAPEAASAKPSELPLHVQETLDRAVKAQEEFLKLGQADVDRIFDFVANEANKHRLPLAKLAVKETRMGQTEDKVIKNGIAWYVCDQMIGSG